MIHKLISSWGPNNIYTTRSKTSGITILGFLILILIA